MFRYYDVRLDYTISVPIYLAESRICEINGGLRFTDGQGRAAIFGG